MKNGDLANNVSYVIAFRCDDSLVKIKTEGFKNKVLNTLLGATSRAEINESYVNAMEHLYRNTEYTVDLVILREKYTADMKRLIEDLPFSRVVLIDKESQISQRLLVGDITLYVDENEERRSLVNSQYAIPLSRLSEFIRRKR